MEKIDDVVIKWNKNYNGVEIKVDGEHFVVDANPSYTMGWNDAVRFYNHPHRSHTWKLPTVIQLQVLAKHINKVNEVIRENNGYEINGWYWSCEEYDEFRTWGVFMYDESVGYTNNSNYGYVRAVSVL